ncbi:MAG: hypothetical protein ACTSWR_12380 [Candidatus Helarchaeota archaeon]
MNIKFTTNAENYVSQKIKEFQEENIKCPYAIGIYGDFIKI